MKNYLRTFVFLLFLLPTFGIAKNGVDSKPSDSNLQDEIHSLQQELQDNNQSLEQLRRDQLNYQIERDLLEKTYGSNIQTINLVITIVLGVFTVIGIFGIRDISKIRDNYNKELERLSAVRHEIELTKVRIEQDLAQSKARFEALVHKSEEQDNRLRVLEFLEKVRALVKDKQYALALDYALLGLELSPDNEPLQFQKALCAGRLGDFDTAYATTKLLYQRKPENSSYLRNFIELTFLIGKGDEGEGLVAENLEKAIKPHGTNLVFYFSALNLFHKKDAAGLKRLIADYVKTLPADQPISMRWTFDELGHFVSRLPANELKALLGKVYLLLSGEVTPGSIKL